MPTAAGLDTYLNNIKEESLLSAEEEVELAAAIAAGDPDARSRMIQANLRLVVKIARDYVNRGMSLDDLIGEGNLGLMRAVEEYDPRYGTRFSTYGSYWIKQAIRHALTNLGSTIRLPTHMVTILTKWRRAEKALAAGGDAQPTFDEIAQVLGLTDAQKDLVRKAKLARTIGTGSAEFDSDGSINDSIAHDCSPCDALETEDERAFIATRLDRLDQREQTIIALRFGLNGEEPLTLKQVGLRLGVTREWVRKIEIRALKKMADEED